MRRNMMKSKIHRATVTDSNLDYEGSITIDSQLMDKAAHKAKKGDIIIIVTYASFEEQELEAFKPKKVYVDGANKIKTQLLQAVN